MKCFVLRVYNRLQRFDHVLSVIYIFGLAVFLDGLVNILRHECFWSRKHWKKQSLMCCLFCFCKTFLKPLKKSKRLLQYQSDEDGHHAMKVLMLFPSTNVCFVQKYSCLDVRELFKKHKKKMWMNMWGAPPPRVQKGHYLASIRISEKLQFLFS